MVPISGLMATSVQISRGDSSATGGRPVRVDPPLRVVLLLLDHSVKPMSSYLTLAKPKAPKFARLSTAAMMSGRW